MTPEQAITVLDALLSKLGSAQRSRLSPAPALSSETNGLVQEDLSFDTISGAIWTLGNNDARPTLQVFFDQVFSSLYGNPNHRVDWDVRRHGSCADTPIGYYQQDHTCCLPCLDETKTGFLDDDRFSVGAWDLVSVDCLSSLGTIVVEIVIASLLQILIIVCENQSSETHLLEFTDLFYLVVRIFDEALLPMHLSPECDEDVIHLVAGLLTLFQIFKTLEHINLVAAIGDQLLSGLLSSDIVERTIRSLQATNSDMAAATCEQFVARLLCLGGFFSETCMTCTAILEPAIGRLNKKKNVE
ncbi:hypothetical protein EC957_004057 [Mortierella hygrophila]|uniref:Uncharacterized protein n=1 Tax=Mortierella hygrophila TaxID=979708 RepID=A0A9P6K017_9FUNG|nr:hypothetical protein EC957_004057 [Mortierella hygrophila]